MGTVIKPLNIDSSNIRAFFTTRIFNNNNEFIGAALSKEFDIPEDKIYLPVQKHTGKIHVLEARFEPVVADAVVTDRENILIGILVADCVPVLLYDGGNKVIGAVHAGWRGTAKQILKNTIEIMKNRFRCSSENISVAIGPSIRQCSYEVGEDVKTEVQKATGEGNYYRKQGEKYYVDLSTANKIQALHAGIPRENIWQSDECTFCGPDKFYSYRFSKDAAGRQGGFIGMW